ncbi:6-phosphogluconolactonase [Achromobacter aloeverae]
MTGSSRTPAASGTLHVYATPAELIEGAAKWLVEHIEASEDRYALALSGGSTPKPLYERLARPDLARRIDWKRVHLFWGDERFVPHDHPDSNYRMAKLALIDHVPIPPANVHAVPTDGTPESAAQRYARTLRDFYGADRLDPNRPLFDLNLLGIGDDGHTASLFPGAPQLLEEKEWVAAVVGQKPEPRITLTYPVLDSADTVAFLAQGAAKREPVARARRHDPNTPAGLVAPRGDLLWFLDKAAAPAQ